MVLVLNAARRSCRDKVCIALCSVVWPVGWFHRHWWWVCGVSRVDCQHMMAQSWASLVWPCRSAICRQLHTTHPRLVVVVIPHFADGHSMSCRMVVQEGIMHSWLLAGHVFSWSWKTLLCNILAAQAGKTELGAGCTLLCMTDSAHWAFEQVVAMFCSVCNIHSCPIQSRYNKPDALTTVT